MIGQFFSLTPDNVLAAVEQAGARTTGLCYALNSLENRVYEVELVDERRVVAKFYRPGRWDRDTILDEHRLLMALVDMEIPVCAPTPFPSGDTLATTADGIHFAIFPRTGGRSPDELSLDEFTQLGRLLARIHNVSAHLKLNHRPVLSPATYGTECLQLLQSRGCIAPSVAADYAKAVGMVVDLMAPHWEGLETFVVHADCHRGNLLRGREGWFFLDFDDMARGPAVQDLWLLLPARPTDCPAEVEAMLEGYEQFRAFPRASLRLVEGLRALRYVRYAAWVASRWEDPS
ncbi:MAG TPA: serine/threonine protein kinase, partial [Myxococcota bacterium]|nr:serine/threonine protein kinase [Myxococcota bacterium]